MPDGPSQTGSPAAEARDLSFAFAADSPVLDRVTATFAPARVTAVVGPNGSGKTTLLRLLAGVLTPEKGEARVAGRSIATVPEPERAGMLAYLPQRSEPAFRFTTAEVTAFGALGRPADEARTLALESLERVGLADRASATLDELSAGQRQLVALARARCQLAARPTAKVLLADEPTAAMDPRHAIATLTGLRELAREGCAVVVVVHDLSLALRFADDAVLLDDFGRVAAAGPAAEVIEPAVLGPVYGIGFVRADTSEGIPAVLPTEPLG